MPGPNIPFVRGQNVVLKLYQVSAPITLPAKVWDVEENATENNDGVNGENRDRLDKVTNFYSMSVDIYQADESTMTAYLAAQAADDAAGIPLTQTGAIQIQHRDGTRAAYMLQGMKIGPMKTSQSGRADVYMLNLKIRFQYFKPIPTI